MIDLALIGIATTLGVFVAVILHRIVVIWLNYDADRAHYPKGN